jgi:ketosteroid isomerase-like protein
LISEDVTYRAGGDNALSGTFHGREEVSAHLREVVERTGDTYEALKWEDWLVGEDHVAAIVRVHAEEHGAVLTARLVILLAFDPADKISEITVLFDDARSTDRFIGP